MEKGIFIYVEIIFLKNKNRGENKMQLVLITRRGMCVGREEKKVAK